MEGENLMLRRTFLKIPQHKEAPQRKNIFKTTYKSHGNISKVIIDYGSIEIILDLEIVKMLKLKMLLHTSLYKVPWLNKGQQVQTWVEFEI